MDLKSIPMFSALRSSMSWLDKRQKVLAENVANSSMPGYRAQDLEELDFSAALKAVEAKPMHHAGFSGQGTSFSSSSSFGPSHNAKVRVIDSPGSETSPDGNSVVLEEQMMKIAETQIQFEAAANLYQKGLNLLRIATRGR